MKNDDWIRPLLLVLGVAGMFLVSTGIAVAMARDGLVTWTDAHGAVRALSTCSTILVALVGVTHALERRKKERKPSGRE